MPISAALIYTISFLTSPNASHRNSLDGTFKMNRDMAEIFYFGSALCSRSYSKFKGFMFNVLFHFEDDDFSF